MNDIIMWIIIGVVALAALAFLVYYIIKIAKLSPEKRKELLVTYLKGAVALAEQEVVGSSKGKEKLAMVEEYFNKNAPWFLKILLGIFGKENLQELIELALKEVKESFVK